MNLGANEPCWSLSLQNRALASWCYHEPEINCAGAARNVAIGKATGDILVFLDDDVLLEPNFIEEILAS